MMKISATQSIGNRIRIARKQAKLSQGELADKVGLTRVSIGQIERGNRNGVKFDILAKISKCLNKPESYLLGETSSLVSNEDKILNPSDGIDEIARKILLLPPSKEQLALRVINEIIDLLVD